MNLLDRGFLYVGVLSIASLAVLAFFGEKVVVTKSIAVPPAEEVFVGTLDTGQCYISNVEVRLSSTINTILSDGIKWTALGSNHSYTIDLGKELGKVDVPQGGSSKPMFNLPVGSYQYTITNNTVGGCSGPPGSPPLLPSPGWVHVSK